jgi:ABC-type branched-subunit amino acid transport system substrate-binding protein
LELYQIGTDGITFYFMKSFHNSLKYLLCLLPFLIYSEGVYAEDLVIGISAAFRGPSRGLGIELYRGSMAYIEHINKGGGINGRKILMKAYDDGYNPIPAIENTIKLIEEDNVLLLFDYVGTPTVTRVLPLLKRYRNEFVYLFFPFTGAQPHRQPPYDEFVFNLRASYRQETEGLVDNFVKAGRKRIAIFYQVDAYGRSGWDGVKKALAKFGLKIVGEATYRRGAKYSEEFKRQVELLRKVNPDAIISIGAYAACAGFIRDARDADWDVPIANVSFVGSENLLNLLLETGKATGRDYTVNLINSQVVPSYEDTSLPAVKEYRELMDRYNPMPPKELMTEEYKPLRYSFVSFEGFLNAKLLVEILKRMGSKPERARIKETVESIENLDIGINTPVSFGPYKHQGLDLIYYTTVRNGLFVPITDWPGREK